MNLVVAAQAAPRDELSAGVSCRREPALGTIRGAGMARPVMAVLAQVGHFLREQLVVLRAMHVVTGEAVALDRRGLVNPGAALVSMAAGAQRVDRLALDHRLAQRAVGIVAVGALDLAFDDRVMRRLSDLRDDFFVAGRAGFILQLLRRGHVGADRRTGLLQNIAAMDAVTVAAGDVVLLVLAGVPEGEIAVVFMAGQAGCSSVFGGNGFRARVNDPADAPAAARLYVRSAIAMTRRALTGIGRAFQIALLAVNRSSIAVDLVFMTALANLRPRGAARGCRRVDVIQSRQAENQPADANGA